MKRRTLTDIPGVYGCGMCCGIKPEKLDLCYIYVPECSGSAATFTTNYFRAPCVTYSEEVFAKNLIKAVVINSGNANAATGEPGYKNAQRTAAAAAEMLAISPNAVAVASTGIIGVALPIDKIESGLEKLLKAPLQCEGEKVSDAILTTDLVAKEVFLEREISGQRVAIAGTAKGSGMIAPNMATMLGFLATDISMTSEEAREFLKTAVQESFNMISVDTDTSTNDAVMLFSTGAKDVKLSDSATRHAVQDLITEACRELAIKIVRDGEGATKLISVHVKGAQLISDAQAVARSIIDSPLVKTAVHGADPNWGRIVMAIGKTPNVEIIAENVEVFFGTTKVFSGGLPIAFDRAALRTYLQGSDVEIYVDLGNGSATATAWGCDLSHGYVDINVAYS